MFLELQFKPPNFHIFSTSEKITSSVQRRLSFYTCKYQREYLKDPVSIEGKTSSNDRSIDREEKGLKNKKVSDTVPYNK
jgi:hypothetical protein